MTEPSTPKNDSKEERAAEQQQDWASLATALAADKTERTGRKDASAEPPRGMQRAIFSSSLALVLGFIAITVAGMLWWQYRQFYVSLDQTDAAAAVSLERVRAEQRALQDGLRDLRDEIGTLRQQSAGIGARVDVLPGRFVEIEQRLDAVQGGSFDARGIMLRSEAEYYLSVANTELALAGNWENAITALELADGRLVELANPALAPVREAIAGELLALRSMRLPDIEGIVFSLGRLAARADSLALRADLPATFADAATSEIEAEPGFERLWLTIKRTLLGLVRIERRDDPVPEALSAAERQLGRRQLELELTLARLAALRTQAQAFQSSLDAAMAILRRDFDTDSADVEGALALLRELRGFQIDPSPPSISGSLNLLSAQNDEAR
jgi:uroporphyrin-3 C-methyltransferase